MIMNQEMYEKDQTLCDQQIFPHPQQDSATTTAAAMDLEQLHQQMGFEIDQNIYNQNKNMDTQEPNYSNWQTHHHQEPNFNQCHQIQEMHNISTNTYPQSFTNSDHSYTPTHDFLNLFHLQNHTTNKLGFLGDSTSSTAYVETGSGSSALFDPSMYHMNLPPQAPSMFHLYGGVEGMERSGEFGNGVLEFSRGVTCLDKGKKDGNNKDSKHFATERQRRVQMNDKYNDLKALLPISTKCNLKIDRASIVGDAIEYIKELQRTVNELNVLVEKKRYNMERMRRHNIEDTSVLEGENNMKIKNGDTDQVYNGSSSIRTSWLQRKSKNVEVDVRIIDDQVTVKMVQQKRISCLLVVSKVLDELQLDLQHVAGGLIGDFYSFLFNLKIYEGSSVYASAIANKLIDAVDRQYAASQPSNNY